MSFGTRLKERREQLGITQPQLAEMLGVSKGAIGNYETDANSPKATILYKVFDVLKCDANYLFQDEMKNLHENRATPYEMENLVKKYRALDEHGRKLVDLILEEECDRCHNATMEGQITLFDLLSPEELEEIEKLKDKVPLTDFPDEFVKLMKKCNSESKNDSFDTSAFTSLNAAHDRTDVPVTDEMKKHDDDIMDSDDF